MEREVEQKRLSAELRQLELQQATQPMTVLPELVERVLSEMHEVMAGDDVRAAKALLAKVVTSLDMGPTGGTLL